MRTIRVNLNKGASIETAIAELREYKELLHDMAKEIVENLANVGIETAAYFSGNYKGYISFEKKTEDAEIGCVGALIASDKSKIISRWIRKGGEVVSAEVSPLLMAEFGSGLFANVVWDSMKGLVGQGTFTYPDQIRSHAKDPNGWNWVGMDEKWHHSRGSQPTEPMHKAWLDMMQQADKIAYETAKTYFR